MREHYWTIIGRMGLLAYGRQCMADWERDPSSATVDSLGHALLAHLHLLYTAAPLAEPEWCEDCEAYHDGVMQEAYHMIRDSLDMIETAVVSAASVTIRQLKANTPKVVYEDGELPEVVFSAPGARAKA